MLDWNFRGANTACRNYVSQCDIPRIQELPLERTYILHNTDYTPKLGATRGSGDDACSLACVRVGQSLKGLILRQEHLPGQFFQKVTAK